MTHADIAQLPGVTLLSTCTLPPSQRNDWGKFGSLILDSSGLVFKCSAAAARILGGTATEIENLPIWKLITDLLPCDTSPAFNANYLTQRCSMAQWSSFDAMNLAQQHFPVELAITGIDAEDSHLFLIHLRQAAIA